MYKTLLINQSQYKASMNWQQEFILQHEKGSIGCSAGPKDVKVEVLDF